MVITVRVYRQHDMDLVTLACDKTFRLGKEIKKALIAGTGGKEYVPKSIPEQFASSGYVPRIIRVQFSLNEKRPDEKRALKFLSNVKRGYRCSFLKALFRNNYTELPLSEYFSTSGFELRKTRHKTDEEKESIEQKPKQADTKTDNVNTKSVKSDDLDKMFDQLNQIGG